MLKLIVLYPQPADVGKFDEDHKAHVRLFHEKTGIPANVKPYKITKMQSSPNGLPAFYRMFSMPFNSPEELQATMDSAAMQEIAADAQRISTGGPLVVMIGDEE
jgi:uncharacterized protein (TIGR02118 family)